MKWLVSMFLFVAVLVNIASATVWVKGYYRDSGTYVESYQRSTPSESYNVHGEYKWEY